MVRIGDIDPKDKRFWPDKPDHDFSPERNKRIINATIKKYEKMRAGKQKEFVDQLRERTEAVASFLKSKKGAQYANATDDKIVRYFGKRYLAHLRGEAIIDNLRQRLGLAPSIKKPALFVDAEGNPIGGKKISDVREKKEKRKKNI